MLLRLDTAYCLRISECRPGVNDCGMVVISMDRSKAIIVMVKYSEGHDVSSTVTPNYFDCSVNIQCDTCEEVLINLNQGNAKRVILRKETLSTCITRSVKGTGRQACHASQLLLGQVK